MAIATTLRLVFDGSGDKKVIISYPNADGDATDAQVKTLMETIITNKDIFAEPPLAIVSAEFVSREVTAIDVS